MSGVTESITGALVAFVATLMFWMACDLIYQNGWREGARQCQEAPTLSECKKAAGK